MYFAVLTLIAMSILIGCSDASDQTDVASSTDTNFLALGDSYTIGESVDRDDSWPVQLAKALRADGIDVQDPRIIARTGWTCADLSAALDREPPGRTYKLVTLLIGVNDQYRGGKPDAYKPAFATLLGRAIGLAGSDPRRVVVLSIPDWSVTPFGRSSPRGVETIAQEIDAFNAINRAEAARAGVAYVDVTPVSRETNEGDSLTAEDGLHPSAAMYAKWTALALPAAKQAASQRE